MGPLLILAGIILTLILLNGLFACMEIAVVSVPRTRLKRYQKEKRPGAATAIKLQKEIDRFFATVQIGVTFVATLSSALAGASALEIFTPVLEKLGVPADSATGHVLSILAISVTLSYITLVIGELVPKSLARRYPGRISLMFARPFRIFADSMLPVVWVLTKSTTGVLKLLRIKETSAPSLTPEELRMMASELLESRQIPQRIYEMLVRVTRFSQIRVEDVMIPRARMIVVHADSRNDSTLRDKILRIFRKHPFTYFPVMDRRDENVLGVVNVKDLLLRDKQHAPSELLRPAFFAVRGQTLDRILSAMQLHDEPMWVVVDEHGNIDGIITLEDVLEELIGDIESITPVEMTSQMPLSVPKEDFEFTADGLITLHELQEQYSISLPQSLYYSTLAGFMLDKLGKIPSPGDYVEFENLRFEVLAMEENRIKEVRVMPLKTSTKE
jgi:putative hemolysin